MQDLIENRCSYRTPVTVITHDIDFVNKMVSEGQYFFTDIEKDGILLYDALAGGGATVVKPTDGSL